MKRQLQLLSLFLIFYITSNAQVPDWLWAKPGVGFSFGTDYPFSTCTDASGNLYVAGRYTSKTITFGSVVLTNADTSGYTSDFFVIKYNPAGTALWGATGGGMGLDQASGVTVDGTGSIFICGSYGSRKMNIGNLILTN